MNSYIFFELYQLISERTKLKLTNLDIVFCENINYVDYLKNHIHLHLVSFDQLYKNGTHKFKWIKNNGQEGIQMEVWESIDWEWVKKK